MSTLDPYTLCSCGSGKKYKFCCMEKDRAAAKAAKESQEKKEAENNRLKPSVGSKKVRENHVVVPTSKKIFRGSQRGS